MNFFSRQPREIGQLRTDYAPPSVERTMADLIRDIRDMPEPESEVMPDESEGPSGHSGGTHDTRPLSATGADRINPLDDIALRMRRLTYGQMIELAEQIWHCRGDGIEEQGLPAILHKWAVGHGGK